MARGFTQYKTPTPDTSGRLVFSSVPTASWNVGGTTGGEAYAVTPMERFREQRLTGIAGFEPFSYGGMTASQRRELFGDPAGEAADLAGQFDTGMGGAGIAQLLAAIGGGSGASAGDTLAARKYADERADRQAQIRAYQDYLASGRLAGGFAGERENVDAGYETALRNIAEGYGEAQGLTSRGYEDLRSYLGRTAVNPYEGLAVNAGLATNPMEQFLEAYGAAGPEVQAAVAAEQAARESGAGAFQSLIDILSGASTEAQRSRQAETEMAANLASTLLGQQRAGVTSQAELARRQALAQIAQREADRQFAIEQALLGLGRFPSEPGSGAVDAGIVPANTMTREQQIQQIASGARNLKDAATQFAPKFMAENPKATAAEIKKQFPKLAEAVAAAKKK